MPFKRVCDGKKKQSQLHHTGKYSQCRTKRFLGHTRVYVATKTYQAFNENNGEHPVRHTDTDQQKLWSI